MFGLDFLDLLIGIFLVYFVLAVMASALTEVVASFRSLRAKNLVHGIKVMLQDSQAATETFYSHPAIKALAPLGQEPSYIPADVVARVYTSIQTTIPQQVQDDIAKALTAYAGEDLQRIENLFNSTMDRAIGWYKRQTQLIVLFFAIVVVTISNADTIMLFNSLWQDPTARAQLVAIAEQQELPNGEAFDDLRQSVETRESVANLGILGWQERDDTVDNPREIPSFPDEIDLWISKIIGLTITVGAVSMGAPFWFEKLSQMMKARASLSGKKPDDSGGGTAPAPPTPATG